MTNQKKRSLLIVAAAVLLAVILAVVFLRVPAAAEKELPEVTEVSFTLNGADYPQSPVLQDFLDCGWAKGEWIEQMGVSPDGVTKPSELQETGYRVKSGAYYVNAYLNKEDCESEMEAEACRVRSLSVYGQNVESFCLDGKELVGVDSERIVDVLGEPKSVEEDAYGKTYHYALPEQGISDISFAFPNSSQEVTEIFVVF